MPRSASGPGNSVLSRGTRVRVPHEALLLTLPADPALSLRNSVAKVRLLPGSPPLSQGRGTCSRRWIAAPRLRSVVFEFDSRRERRGRVKRFTRQVHGLETARFNSACPQPSRRRAARRALHMRSAERSTRSAGTIPRSSIGRMPGFDPGERGPNPRRGATRETARGVHPASEAGVGRFDSCLPDQTRSESSW